MEKNIIILLLFLCTSFPIKGQVRDSVKFKLLEPYDFHMTYLKEDKAVLIDVREFFEYKRKRIKDAINIPSSGNLDFAADTLDKESVLFLYCTTDYRSNNVAKKFSEKGFQKVYSLDGGINAWKKDGFPIERKKIRRK